MTNERLKKLMIEVLAAAVSAATLLAAMPAAAIPGAGLGSAMAKPRPAEPPVSSRQPIGPGQPSIMIHQDSLREFEELTGQQMSSSQLSNLQRMVDTIDGLNAEPTSSSTRPQKVRWDLGRTGYEFTILVCGHLRTDINGVIPQKAKDVLGKVPPYFKDKIQTGLNKGNVDIIPCYDPHTGLSYVMLGIGGSTNAGSPLTVGLSVGIYFAPKTDKMVIGDYVFGRASMSMGAMGKWDALTAGGDLRCAEGVWNLATKFSVDFSNCSRAFISTGLSFDMGGAIIAKLKAWKKGKPKDGEPAETANGTNIDLGLWSFSGGVVIKMHEFPWFSRLRSGMGFKETFSDIDKYIAANN